jgi:hypothetical protein
MDALQTLRDAAKSRTTLAIFGVLALTSLIPRVVDPDASPVYFVLGLPSYLVTMLFYDSPVGLENLVYPVAPVADSFVSGGGHLLWEAGEIGTFYLFALAVGWIAALLRSGDSRNPEPTR